MTRRDLVLAILSAADGQTYTPVQLQKAAFLVAKNFPDLVDDGPSFGFVPYDYGPFDVSVYSEAGALRASGEADVAPSGSGRWNTYAATRDGLERGRELLDGMKRREREYIRAASSWVRSLSFGQLVKSIYEAYPEMRANSIFRE